MEILDKDIKDLCEDLSLNKDLSQELYLFFCNTNISELKRKELLYLIRKIVAEIILERHWLFGEGIRNPDHS